MKYFWKLVWMFIPRGDVAGSGNGSGDGTGDGTGTGSGSGNGNGKDDNHKPIGGSDPESKPDWLSEKFWNPDLKTPRTEVLGKAYNELESKLRSNSDTIKEEIRAEMKASAPDEYKVNLSKDLKIPDNVELDFTEDDPMVKWFFGMAKEEGMPQETVDKWINEYVGIELGNMTDIKAEIEKLGDHGQDRMLRVHNWLESKLSDDQFKALNPFLSTAVQVEALEVLMKTAAPSDFQGDGGGSPLSLEELRDMQNDPKAWQEKNPIFLKKIQEGYDRLYKNQ